MAISYVPLLAMQRDLYRIPRGMDRFRAYLREMIDWQIEEMRLPLFVMNPMAKEHVPAFLDRLLELSADEVGAQALAEAGQKLAEAGEFKFTLVVADDVAGGWTNRYATEFTQRFDSGRLYGLGWATGILWVSEPPTIERMQDEVRTTAFRLAYVRQHGPAQTLRQRLAQEGWAMQQAACTGPVLEDEDLAYTREVIAPFLDSTDMRTTIECLWGDEAGATLGFTPRGLSPWAGLALARDGRI